MLVAQVRVIWPAIGRKFVRFPKFRVPGRLYLVHSTVRSRSLAESLGSPIDPQKGRGWREICLFYKFYDDCGFIGTEYTAAKLQVKCTKVSFICALRSAKNCSYALRPCIKPQILLARFYGASV